MSNSVDKIISNIPKWLELTKDNTNGKKILNSIGLELDDVNNIFDELQDSLYINTANVEMPYMVYKVPILTDRDDIIIDIGIKKTESVYEFLTSSARLVLVDYDNKIIYINKKQRDTETVKIYTVKTVNGEKIQDEKGQYDIIGLEKTYTINITPHHIWNAFDEFALLFGMKRKQNDDGTYESNESLKDRIINYINSDSSNTDDFFESIVANELGLKTSEISIKKMSDMPEYIGTEVNKELIKYIDIFNSKNDIVDFRWDKKQIDFDIVHLSYAPRLMFSGLSNIPDKFIQNGIGQDDDLLVIAPKKESSEQQFNAQISIIGNLESKTKYYPKHSVVLKSYATGTKMLEIPEPVEADFTFMASRNIDASVEVKAKSEFNSTKTLNIQDFSLYNLDIKDSNVIYNNKEQYLKVNVKLYSSSDRLSTPVVNSITVNYKKTDGTYGTFPISLGDATNNIDNQDGKLRLAKGTYSRSYSKPISWQDGTVNGIQITSTGLKLPKA